MLIRKIYTTCLAKPSFAAGSEVIECPLHLLVEVPKVHFGGISRYPDRRRHQDDGPGEGKRNLEFVPALELKFAFQRDMKAENRRAGFESEQDRSLFGDIARPARPINREGRVLALFDVACEL